MDPLIAAVDSGTDDFAPRLAKVWWLIALLGAALVVVGVLLVANLPEAAFSLALLIGIGLMIAGIDEFVEADRHRRRWAAYLLGALFILTGIVAIAWPGVTLWALAVVVGIGLLVTGVIEIVFAIRLRRETPGWYWPLISGVLAVVAGVIALVWPTATVSVLAVLLGIWVILRGLAVLIYAFAVRTLK